MHLNNFLVNGFCQPIVYYYFQSAHKNKLTLSSVSKPQTSVQTHTHTCVCVCALCSVQPLMNAFSFSRVFAAFSILILHSLHLTFVIDFILVQSPTIGRSDLCRPPCFEVIKMQFQNVDRQHCSARDLVAVINVIMASGCQICCFSPPSSREVTVQICHKKSSRCPAPIAGFKSRQLIYNKIMIEHNSSVQIVRSFLN